MQLDDSRKSARAWIGAMGGVMAPPIVNEPAKITISYVNTGKEPGATFDAAAFKLFTKEEWKNGAAVSDILSFKDYCMKVDKIEPTRVAFPTTGFSSYNMSIITNAEDFPEKYVVDDDLVSGRRILVIKGCLIYKTANKIAHSPFCYSYQAAVTLLPNLNICTVGWGAD